MAVIRWNDPFRDLAAFQERMNRVFEESLGRRQEEEIASGTWAPPVDIFETKDRMILQAELPGFAEDQIHLRFEDGVLTLEGERKFEKKTGDENYHRVERSYGRFVRSFSIPATVDHERIAATFENGILTVELPKREETRPKQIRIQAASPTIAVKSLDSAAQAARPEGRKEEKPR
jgi:HSP20 family protein